MAAGLLQVLLVTDGHDALLTGVGAWLVFAVPAAVIYARKGYLFNAIMAFVFGAIPFAGLLFLILALARQDKIAAAKQAEERRLRDVQMDAQRLAIHKQHLDFKELKLKQAAGLGGQIRCPRCGTTNAIELTSCWSCSYAFDVPAAPEVSNGATPRRGQASALAIAAEPKLMECPACGTLNSPGRATCRHCEGGLPVSAPSHSGRSVGNDIDPVKVACKACGKKFTGQRVKIASLGSCPRCSATPFDVTEVL